MGDKDSSPVSVSQAAPDNPEIFDMAVYQRDVPLWKRVWQHSLTQMLLLSIQAFCGPAMADAIAGEFGSAMVRQVSTDGAIPY